MLTVVMIEPENAGNIGAVARVMKNFGYRKLMLIQPKADHLSEESRCRAKHAQEILKKAEVAAFSALDSFDQLIGTTAKTGTDYNILRSPVAPDKLTLPEKGRHALLLGREGTGLSNAELKKCQVVLSITASGRYPTLNISHALAILLYELSRHTSGIAAATKKDLAVLGSHIERCTGLLDFSTAQRKRLLCMVWKRVLGKAMLTRREAFALMGFFRRAADRLHSRGR